MKKINSIFRFLIILATQIQYVIAATYYISSKTGDDSRTNAQAQNQSTPWKSSSKINGLALGAGDQVAFERGGSFLGSIQLGKGSTVAGLAGSPVTIGTYGIGEAPIITGAEIITSLWIKYQGNIWVTSKPDSVEQLFVNGHSLTLARFPNTGTVPITSVVSSNVFKCSGLVGKNLQGATAFARTEHWTWETNVISSFDAATGQVSISGKTANSLKANWGAWFNNHLSLLDTAGEWYYDAAGGKLYTWLSENADPNKQVMEASKPAAGLVLTNVKHAIIQDLIISGFGGDGIRGDGSDIIFQNLKIENPVGSGIRVGGPQIMVKKTSVIGANVYGISLNGNGSKVVESSIQNIAKMSRLTSKGLGGECCSGRGINISGSDIEIRDNTLDSIGYVGIGFGGERSLVEHNLIQHYCMTTDDGAAVYTWSSDFNLPGSAGTKIRKNLVLNAIGAPDGIPDRSTFANGIYLDDRIHDVVIEQNTVSGTDVGIFVHNNRDDTVRNNVSYANKLGQLMTQRDNIVGNNDMYGTVIENNTLYATVSSGPTYSERIYQANATPLIASRKGDLECRESILGVRCERDGKLVWEKTTPISANDTVGKSVYAYNFTPNSQGWSTWPSPPSVTVFDAIEHAGSLRLDYAGDTANRAPLLYAPKNFAVKKGEMYLFKFSAKANATLRLDLIPRQSGPPYANLAPTNSFSIGTDWVDNQYAFEIITSDSSCRIDFNWPRAKTQFWIDDVSLIHLPPVDTTLGPLSVLYSNTNASDVLINPSLGGTWLNVKGEKQSSGVTLQQFEAVITIRDTGKLSAKIKNERQSQKKGSTQLLLQKMQSSKNSNKIFRDLNNTSIQKWRDAQGRISK